MGEKGTNKQGERHQIYKLAILSMVLGIFGFFSPFLSWILALSRGSGLVVGIVALFLNSIPVLLCGSGLFFGTITLRKITKSDGLLVGRGFAVAGLVISVLGFFIPALVLVHYTQFLRQAQVAKIDDVSSKTTLTLSADGDPNKVVDGISILITGHIDSSATIRIHNGHGVYYTRHITKGLVFLKIEGDRYTDKCCFEYEPTDVHSGHLTIRYVIWERVGRVGKAADLMNNKGKVILWQE